MPVKAVMVLAPGFEETEAVATIDLLRRAGVELTLLALAGREVTGSHGISLRADQPFAGYREEFEAVILPGGMPGAKNLGESRELLELLEVSFRKGILCAAICAAPVVLAKAGILKGKRAACYPGYESQLEGALCSEETVVRDGNIITSRGVGTAIAFALEIIDTLLGGDKALQVAKAVLFPWKRK